MRSASGGALSAGCGADGDSILEKTAPTTVTRTVPMTFKENGAVGMFMNDRIC